ncbi:Urease accessory protein UreD, partial [Dillenia turbinata]
VGPSKTDAVWIYTITYGGGLVSGDSVSVELDIGHDCTAVITTQASTKVYKSVEGKCSVQVLEARIGSNALLVIIPDPVTCFSTARYSQKQVFRVASTSSLLLVDWITSGRHQSGEKWDFQLYKSSNQIYLQGEGDQPLFIDSVVLEEGTTAAISERMQGYQVIAMVVLLGLVLIMIKMHCLLECRPKLKQIQDQVQENVRKMMAEQLHHSGVRGHNKANSGHSIGKPLFLASCSTFGPKFEKKTSQGYLKVQCDPVAQKARHKGVGVVVRIAATTTESVYKFLEHQLGGMESLLGVAPYRG